MKKIVVVLLISFMVLMPFVAGCGDTESGTANGISLANKPIVDEQIFDISGKDEVSINFDVPQKGYIKLYAYDFTEYEEYPEEESPAKVSFFDKDNKALFENIDISNGYAEQYAFEKGAVTAKITFDNKPKDMKSVAVAWVYAAETTEPTQLKTGEIGAASVNKEKTANFSIKIEKDGIYNITCAEGALPECDCNFSVIDKNGVSVTGEIFIHTNEWISRKAFLPKGEYVINVRDVTAVATCNVEETKSFENIVLAGDKNLKLPVDIGFTAEKKEATTVTFTPSGKTLIASADGSGTYYDSEQPFEIKIADSNGKTVIEEECEGSGSWDISNFSGEHTITVTAKESCVVSLSVK